MVVGDDGGPGARGAIYEPFSLGMRPPEMFQTVMVIAPEPGANCVALSARVLGIDNESQANDRRESLLRVDLNARSPTIRCRKDGERWERKLPRLTFREFETKTRYINGEESEQQVAKTLYAFPPIFHVPGPDDEAAGRWQAWSEQMCAAPDETQMAFLCGRGFGEARAADQKVAGP